MKSSGSWPCGRVRPKHRLGQNFLHDGNQMRRIIAAAGVREGNVVLEVGLGTGSLSEQLLEAGARLVGVELDLALEPILNERLAPWNEQSTLLMMDVLESKHTINPLVLDALERMAGDNDPGRFKLVSNLPYGVASPLLANLAAIEDGPSLEHGVVMVQQEVADRLQAMPGGKDYGALTVVVQARFDVRTLFRVSPDCFWPRPKVYSSVVELRLRNTALTHDPGLLARTTQRLFSQRRKQLGTILGS